MFCYCTLKNIFAWCHLLCKNDAEVVIQSPFIHSECSSLLWSVPIWRFSNKANNLRICYQSWDFRHMVLVIWGLNCSKFLCKLSHWGNPRSTIFIHQPLVSFYTYAVSVIQTKRTFILSGKGQMQMDQLQKLCFYLL